MILYLIDAVTHKSITIFKLKAELFGRILFDEFLINDESFDAKIPKMNKQE